MAAENETLRWPTNLDRKGIEQRLIQVRAYAESHGLADLAALSMMDNQPEHRATTMQLEMVAMNLKNLK